MFFKKNKKALEKELNLTRELLINLSNSNDHKLIKELTTKSKKLQKQLQKC